MTINRLRALILPSTAIAISLVSIFAVVLFISGRNAGAQTVAPMPKGFVKGRELLYLRLDDHEWRKGANCEEIAIFDEGYEGWAGIHITPLKDQPLAVPEYFYVNATRIVMYELGESPLKESGGNGSWYNGSGKGKGKADNSPRGGDWGNK
ncbi:MAG: hypothetical protein H6839_15060 [Planctomycetes bacterium]|nr:hypothetical protein [Planctomycetota bacterium]